MGILRFMNKRALRVLLVCTAFVLAFPFLASARYDPGWEWYTISTDGFIIYYPKGHEQLAQRVLSLSEEVHKDVTGYFGIQPRPCPVVLNPGTDIFNGYMTIFPSRISLYETPLYTVRGFGPGSDLMDLVFTHEYTHYVNITTRLGWYGALTNVIGEGLAVTNGISPGWALEGITTNLETRFTDGGRGRCPLLKGEMMSFTEGKGLWNLNAAAVSSPYSPPGSRIYIGGYHMVDFLNRTYGDDAYARMSRYQAEHPVGGTREALIYATKEYPDQFYFHFLRDFEEQAKKSKEQALAASLPQGKAVTGEDTFLDGMEAQFWTKDNTIVGLRKGYDKKTALVEIDPATLKTVSENDTGVLTNLSARRLPDGRLLLSEVFYHPFAEGEIDTTDLVIFDPAKKKHKRLTRSGHIYSADLSPDGRTFAATRRNGMWIDLVLIDADGSNVRPLVSKPGMYFDSPCWSPDGSRIAAVVKSGANADIVLVDPADGKMELLYQSDQFEENDPEFSPDGKWLVFSSDRSGIWNIYAWDLAAGKLYQLTSVLYVASGPKISPDSKTLSFLNMVRGLNQVRTLDFDPTAGKPVAVQAAGDIAPPDLKRLQPDVSFEGRKGIPLSAYKPFLHVPYFSSDEDGTQAGVYIMGADPVGINTYTLNLLYGLDSHRPGYDISIANRSLWPTLGARIYDVATKDDTIGGYWDFWFRERGAELSASITTIFQTEPSTITMTFKTGPRLRYFSILDDRYYLNPDYNQSIGFFDELKLSRKPDSASRDMVSSWGEDLTLQYEKAISQLGGELPGYNLVVSGTQYVPSIIKHHGLALTVVHQSQKGLLHYSKDLSLPRGYDEDDIEGDLNLRKNLLFTGEYHFPIIYTDSGLGLYAYHSNLLKGSLFIDYGAGWDGDDIGWHSFNHKARASVGGTLTNKCVLFAVLPIEFGVQGGIKIYDSNEGFFSFILKFEL